jgi:NAD+ synthetase
MKIAICQVNTIIGDVEGNKNKILSYYQRGCKAGADLVIFPELSLLGYPPLDLVEKKEFRDAVYSAEQQIALNTNSVGLLFGSITEDVDNIGTNLFNSALLCYNEKIQFIQNKTLIPNYDVFDEIRYFESARAVFVHDFKNERLGISICEDIWNDKDYWKNRLYPNDPIEKLIQQGASILINISASPYSFGKREEKKEMLSSLCKKNNVKLVYVCGVGAQTELVFDGASMCFNELGELQLIGNTFQEDFFIFDTNEKYPQIINVEECFEKEVLNSLVLGLKDYCEKQNFRKVLIGLSGGIDSALVTYIAVLALGSENVNVVLLPSKYSSEGSIVDSLKLINKLNISHNVINIQNVVNQVLETLHPLFNNQPENITEENIQSRTRGLLLMALSNKFNYLLLTTGNKSELATGYATLYGDMCGAIEVIGDVYKTDVYKIVNFINNDEEIIPYEIIDKVPSAELRPNQTDQDSLPDYNVLDRILRMYLEDNKDEKEISTSIGEIEVVKKILKLIDTNEFKRKQTAPVLRISKKAFGYGRRFPIVQGWRK